VTFNWNVEKNWAALEGDGSQANLVSAVVTQYLPAIIYAITREVKDDLVKQQLLSLWTTKNITFTIEPANFKMPEGSLHCWSGYNGIRIVDGNLDMYMTPSTFWCNLAHMENAKFSELLANASGALPLSVRQQIRDTKDRRDAVCARIAKAVGVDAVTWNVEADSAAIVARKDKDYVYDVEPALQYIEALAELVEKKCADDMVKEAVADVFKSKTVGLKIVDNLDKLTGQQMHSSYNGVQFADGGLYAVTTPGNWWTNVSQVADFDIVSLF